MSKEAILMLKEIGSNFWLDPNKVLNEKKLSIEDFGLHGSDYILTSSGRGAEEFVLKEIENKKPDINKIAILPPFTCGTVIEPFIRHGYQVFTYEIDKNLNAMGADLQDCIEKYNASIVLFHKYFGFDGLIGWKEAIEKFQKKGVIFIEDRTQSLFRQENELNVDYIVGSLRKWCGTPDGGYAVCKQGLFSDRPRIFDEELEQLKKTASFMKYDYIVNSKGSKEDFLAAYKKAEEWLDNENCLYRISPLSEYILSNLDIDNLKNRRRENYCFIFNRLSKIKDISIVTPFLQDIDVPLYMCITVSDRRALQYHLIENNIFAPIVWPKEMNDISVCDAADFLYENSLCLPIDQRYGIDDMNRMSNCIEEFYCE